MENKEIVRQDPVEAGKETGKKPKPKKNFLVVYAMTLLVIAFVLVLMSYLNEIRVRKEEIADLQEKSEQSSISAMQDIQSLEEKNDELQKQVESLTAVKTELEQQISALEMQVKDLSGQNDVFKKNAQDAEAVSETMAARQNAIEAMLNITDLYANKKFSYSAYEVSVLESGNSEYIGQLFEGSEVGPRVEKIISRYQAIREWLTEWGYMDAERIANWAAQNGIKTAGDGQ